MTCCLLSDGFVTVKLSGVGIKRVVCTYKAMILSTYDGPPVYLTCGSIMCSALNYFKVLISCLNGIEFLA